MNKDLSGNNGDPIIVPGANLAAKLAWLKSDAQSNNSYIIDVNTDESISPHELSYDDKSNIIITIKGLDSKRTISLTSNGALFKINLGVTLVLDNNITLHGRKDNDKPLVEVSGTLIMNHGSAVINNNYNIGKWILDAGGVHIWKGGIFTMNGGTISGNTSGDAGGVSVCGIFTMNDGTISNNTANSFAGVYLFGGTFTMNGGTISGNIANNASGGGVGVLGGTFTMNGGTISGNTAQSGGGVSVGHSSDMSLIGVFTKTGGTIIGYTSDKVNGNVVKDNSRMIKTGWGHAVAGFTNGNVTEFKDTTSGPTDNMSFNAGNGEATGVWDVETRLTKGNKVPINKEQITLIICSVIGFVIGTIIGSGKGNVILGMWFGIGGGVALGFLPAIPGIFKIAYREDGGFFEALKSTLLGGGIWLIIFMVAGPIGFIIRFIKSK